ncbi:MAG: hypothetical protein ACRD3E_06755 [Terriglobales bacterium]
MKPPCDTCAFGNAGAALEAYNNLRARVCALGAVPFFCHHSIDWQSQHSWKPNEIRRNARQSGVCAGWKREVKALTAKGWFKHARWLRHALAAVLLERINEWADEKDEARKSALLTQIKAMLRVLTQKRPRLTLFGKVLKVGGSE